MRIKCIQCRQLIGVKVEQFGSTVRCPHCREEMTLPMLSAVGGVRWWHYSNYLSSLGSLTFHMMLVLVLAVVGRSGVKQVDDQPGDEVVLGRMPVPEPLTNSKVPVLQSEVQPKLETKRTATQLEEVNVVGVPDSTPPQMGEFTISIASGSSKQSPPDAFKVKGPPVSGGKVVGEESSFEKMLKELRKNGLDIVLTFDSTASMSKEIRQVKDQIGRIGRRLIKLVPTARISICTYRDKGDAYIVKGLPLSRDLGKIERYLDRIRAKGGGDFPEAVDEGLKWAMQKNEFRRKARKVILLFGDAQPHARSRKRCFKLASTFHNRQNGIVSTVTCRSPVRIPDFVAIAESGGGEAFTIRNEREIMKQLMILVFGSRYEQAVKKAFSL